MTLWKPSTDDQIVKLDLCKMEYYIAVKIEILQKEDGHGKDNTKQGDPA